MLWNLMGANEEGSLECYGTLWVSDKSRTRNSNKKIVSKQNSDLPIIYGALNKTLNKIIS